MFLIYASVDHRVYLLKFMSVARQKNSPRNRSIQLDESTRAGLEFGILSADNFKCIPMAEDALVNSDYAAIASSIKPRSVNLLFLDPPYNLSKCFGEYSFRARSLDEYAKWLECVIQKILPALAPNASVYICGDWRSSSAIHQVAEKYFIVRNRITFERDKGRAAMHDWKNNSEDIWFCTRRREYTFNADAVRIKKRVIAPYRLDGKARDWQQETQGRYRLTGSSNVWTDITIPFWSMPENTPHPTQKPEKLLARIILASSNPGDVILDPFGGSGTTAVVARKLNRRYIMTEIDREHCYYAAHRLELARTNKRIQGYAGGVFWERNSGSDQKSEPAFKRDPESRSDCVETIAITEPELKPPLQYGR